MATAFLLLSLGVPVETVVEDFLKTNEYLKAETERKIQKIRELGGSGETAASAFVRFRVKREDIEAAFQAMTEACGSLKHYLEERLGLTEELRTQMEDKYLVKV